LILKYVVLGENTFSFSTQAEAYGYQNCVIYFANQVCKDNKQC